MEKPSGRTIAAWAILVALLAAAAGYLFILAMGGIDGSASNPMFFVTPALAVVSVVLFSRIGHGRWTVFGPVVAVILAGFVLAALAFVGQIYWSSKPNDFWMTLVDGGPYLPIYSAWTRDGLLIAGSWTAFCIFVTCASGVVGGALTRRILGR